MANRNWTSNPDRKITSVGGTRTHGPGKPGSVTVKQAFTSMGLPGKASMNFAKAKKGYRKVDGLASCKGL